MIDSDLSIREAARSLESWDEGFENIPKSTLYDRLNTGIKNKNLLLEFRNHMEKNKTR